jgi:hypothetical protein
LALALGGEVGDVVGDHEGHAAFSAKYQT